MLSLNTANELCRVLGDPTRVRMLAVLAHEALSVAELTQVTGLAQSRVSTHLGRLREMGLVEVRREGTTSYYSLKTEGQPPEVDAVWGVLAKHLDDPLIDADRARAGGLVASRNTEASWSASIAGHMERHYSPGRTWQSSARAFVGLEPLGDVLDVASGDGALAELVAPQCRSLTCIDVSAKVVAAAERRLARFEQARAMEADMHALPFGPQSFDRVFLMSALPYAISLDKVLLEVARVLRVGGRLVGATLAEHRHVQAVEPYGHVNQGFAPDHLRSALESAGFVVHLCEVGHVEKRAPHFEIITLHAERGEGEPNP